MKSCPPGHPTRSRPQVQTLRNPFPAGFCESPVEMTSGGWKLKMRLSHSHGRAGLNTNCKARWPPGGTSEQRNPGPYSWDEKSDLRLCPEPQAWHCWEGQIW